MGKKKKSKNCIDNDVEIWTEEQYEEYLKDLYGIEFVAGFTENGVPYGIFCEEVEHNEKDTAGIFAIISEDDDIPF